MSINKRKDSIHVAKHLFEIRFKENPIVLDKRGIWTNQISEKFSFPDWSISDNLVNLFNQKEFTSAYFSFKNIGYKIDNSESLDGYIKKANEYIDYLFSKDMLGTNNHIVRIGVRSIFCQEYQGSFNELKNSFNSNFGGLKQETKDSLELNLEDICTVLDLSDNLGNIHLISGPMRSEQIRSFLPEAKQIPQVGLYMDIDYWKKPDAIIAGSQLKDIVEELSKATKKRFEQILNLVIGE